MPKRLRRRPDPEAKLDKRVQALVGKSAAGYDSDDLRSLREQLRLTVLYPGQFVAFRDHFQGEGDSRRLVQREVLRASRSLAAVSNHIDRLPQEEKEGVFIDYVEPAKQSPAR